MRQIDVEIDVFSMIWTERLPGENSENEVLRRILLERKSPQLDTKMEPEGPEVIQTATREVGKVRWIDDVVSAFEALGGEASLEQIYKQVRSQRIKGNRSRPKSLDAIVRRSIEEQSSDSESHKGPDLFVHVDRGVWKLRD